MASVDYIELALVLLLCSILALRLRYQPKPLPPSYWTGRGIDVGNLKSRVKTVQAGFESGRTPKQSDTLYRKALVAFARRTVRRLPFFHSTDAESSFTATE